MSRLQSLRSYLARRGRLPWWWMVGNGLVFLLAILLGECRRGRPTPRAWLQEPGRRCGGDPRGTCHPGGRGCPRRLAASPAWRGRASPSPRPLRPVDLPRLLCEACQRGRWSPRTGLALRSSWCHQRQARAKFVLAGRALRVPV